MQNNSTPKISIIITIFVIVFFLVFSFYIKPSNKNIVSDPNKENDQSYIWPSEELSQGVINEKDNLYLVDIKYPIVKDENISKDIKNFIDVQIVQFKADTSWAIDPSIAPAQQQNLSIYINYQREKNKIADNYIFTIATYTGGAHGLQLTKTFVYNKKGKLISNTDLFSDNKKGLDIVSSFVQKELLNKKVGDASWIENGAGPIFDNYQVFILKEDGVEFIFDPYQVASYAEGKQSIVVPFSVFKDFFNSSIIQ